MGCPSQFEARRRIEEKDWDAAVLDLHPRTLRTGMHKPTILPPEIEAKN